MSFVTRSHIACIAYTMRRDIFTYYSCGFSPASNFGIFGEEGKVVLQRLNDYPIQLPVSQQGREVSLLTLSGSAPGSVSHGFQKLRALTDHIPFRSGL